MNQAQLHGLCKQGYIECEGILHDSHSNAVHMLLQCRCLLCNNWLFVYVTKQMGGPSQQKQNDSLKDWMTAVFMLLDPSRLCKIDVLDAVDDMTVNVSTEVVLVQVPCLA